MCFFPDPGLKKYKLHNFLFDILMICLTCGFWLIWIFVREMRGIA